MDQDITRWKQRLANFNKAFDKLESAAHLIKFAYKPELDETINNELFPADIIKEGLIQRFEYTHELAWKVIKDFLVSQGATNIYGSKDATREAFKAGLIEAGDIWMDMIQSRNLTSSMEFTNEVIQAEDLPRFEEANPSPDHIKYRGYG